MALPTPIAYWPFDEASGTTATDASGNGHTATLLSGSFDTSALKKFGTSAYTNSGTYVGASFTAMNLGTVHSVAFWMNGWDGSNDGVVIGGADTFYACYIDGTALYYSVGAGTFKSKAHGGGMTGSHHIVVTRNGTTLTWYKDGTSLGTQTLGVGTALTLSRISNYSTGSTGFAGTLDDVRFYDVALSGAEVAELYALVPAAPPAASARVTQAVIEVLSLPVPSARVTQAVVELLSANVAPVVVTERVATYVWMPV